MPVPKKILIGTQSWEVIERSRRVDAALNEDDYGYTLSKENRIVIDADLTDSRKRQTLFHEIMHAVRFTFGGYPTPKKSDDIDVWEHYFIGMYEEGLLLVLQTNPELLEFLLEK